MTVTEPAFRAHLASPHRHAGLTDLDALALYRTMLLGRRLDERIWTLNRQGKAPFAVSGQGHEGVQAGFAFAMAEDDILLPYYRDLVALLVRGMTPTEILLGVFARADDPCSGARQMPNHWGLRRLGIITGSSPIATHLPHGVGIAYSRKMRGEPGVSFCSFGDGATSEGDFHVALNFAGIHRLPIVFVCENNGYAISVPLDQQSAVEDISLRAVAYDFPGITVDGQSAITVYEVARDARERAARGDGPTLIEAKTYRYHPHTSDDNDKYYRSREEVEKWRRKDPIRRMHDDLITSGILTLETEDEIADSVDAEVAAAVAAAETSPKPEPNDAYRGVYAKPLRAELPGHDDPVIDRTPASLDSDAKPITYITAINETMDELMADDDRVIVLGQDVGDRGGVFGATRGLIETYGDDRVLDTPLAESLVIGAAIGMAIDGLRPIAEIQFLDFVGPGIDQILSEAAKIHYRSNGDFACPLVIRAPYGGGVHGALYHSQCIEALFCHVPGLKVVAPSTPADAIGLLRAAMADPDPVLYLEHKKAYRSVKGLPPVDSGHVTPIGVADIVRIGTDLTIATYGMMRHHAEAASRTLADQGIEAEVIDLRTLRPLDYDLVAESVAKTGRLLVVHEANRTGGIGAELVAEITERSFWDLDAPIRRLGLADVHALPYAPALEQELLFGAPEIVDVAREIVKV